MAFRALGFAVALAVLPSAAFAQNAAGPALATAAKGAHRDAASVARDGARRPVEALQFWGLKPGITVIEISPGGGYWSEILAPYALATNAHAWLAGLADPTGAAQKNAALWNKDLDVAAADFATGNLYALAWLLARTRPTPAEQAATFARFALLVQGRAWLGNRCIDITKIATVLDAPPKVESCS